MAALQLEWEADAGAQAREEYARARIRRGQMDSCSTSDFTDGFAELEGRGNEGDAGLSGAARPWPGWHRLANAPPSP